MASVTHQALMMIGGWSGNFSETLAGGALLGNNSNMRQLISSSRLSAGSKVRVTLTAGTTGSVTIDHAEIGHQDSSVNPWNYDGGQAALTFSSGSAGVTIAANNSVVSDEITFTLDPTKGFIIAFHFSALTTVGQKTSVTTAQSYTKTASASEVSVSTVTGYTTTTNNVYLVSKIEVFN